MRIRPVYRRWLYTLTLCCVAASVVTYFIHQARYGERGLESKLAIKQKIHLLTQEYDALRTEKEAWGRRLAMLQDDAIEKDLLDERARATLGRVHKNDIVILTTPDASRP